MNKIRVAIADDNVELRERLIGELESEMDIQVVAEASTGKEALRMVVEAQADVMLLDMIMPDRDGFDVLEQMRNMSLAHRPKVIAMTALGRDDFIQRAVSMGASYYMIKPVEPDILIQRIYDTMLPENVPAVEDEFSPANLPGATLDDKLSNLFLTLGIPAHIKGYQFLREAIRLVMEKPDMIGGITKELYPTIAKHFGTTSSKVERAIRHAIEVAWGRGRIEALNQAFGCRVVYQDTKPTNGEFIALLADKLSDKPA